MGRERLRLLYAALQIGSHIARTQNRAEALALPDKLDKVFERGFRLLNVICFER